MQCERGWGRGVIGGKKRGGIRSSSWGDQWLSLSHCPLALAHSPSGFPHVFIHTHSLLLILLLFSFSLEFLRGKSWKKLQFFLSMDNLTNFFYNTCITFSLLIDMEKIRQCELNFIPSFWHLSFLRINFNKNQFKWKNVWQQTKKKLSLFKRSYSFVAVFIKFHSFSLLPHTPLVI